MFGLSIWEVSVILLVALVFVGPKRLPELLRTLGSAMRTLRSASDDVREALEEPLREIREPVTQVKQNVDGVLGQIERDLHNDVKAPSFPPSPESPPVPPKQLSKNTNTTVETEDES